MSTMKDAIKAKKKMQKMLKGISGINGIGITWDERGKPCVRVNVSFDIDKVNRSKIPPHIDNVKVKIESIDHIELERY